MAFNVKFYPFIIRNIAVHLFVQIGSIPTTTTGVTSTTTTATTSTTTGMQDFLADLHDDLHAGIAIFVSILLQCLF